MERRRGRRALCGEHGEGSPEPCIEAGGLVSSSAHMWHECSVTLTSSDTPSWPSLLEMYLLLAPIPFSGYLSTLGGRGGGDWDASQL